VVSVLNTFTGIKLEVNAKGEKTDMCKAWEDHRNNGRIEGKNQKLISLNYNWGGIYGKST
jgi:hypothetical protein